MLMPSNDTEEAKWSYSPEGGAPARPDMSSGRQTGESPREQSVSWTASEFIDKHKSGGWYLAFFLGLAMLSGLIFIFTRDYISAGAIVLAGVIFVILTKKKPQQLPYEVNNKGLKIGNRFYQYGDFKSFGLAQEGGIKSINFVPLKRFMPEISIYFPPEQEVVIIGILAQHLPHDVHVEKTMDKLARKLHF
jgi:hypothetical protein